MGTIVDNGATNQTSDPIGVDPNTGEPIAPPAPAPVAAPSPLSNFAGGVGSILLFPGTVLVSPFVGTGDPLDTSHLPITVIISAVAWYFAFKWASGPSGPLHGLMKGPKAKRSHDDE
jgi:hypothetical protein